jgi:hypothetical protein
MTRRRERFRGWAVALVALGALGAQRALAREEPAPSAQGAPSTDPWAPIRRLVGTWEGTSSGVPGRGDVKREIRWALRERFVEIRNASTYPPQERNPAGEAHEDVGFVSFDRRRGVLVLRQFHVEGFVNTYVAEVAKPGGDVVFTTEAIENIAPGWRARETWRMAGEDELVERFELAAPGKGFELYSESRLRRVGPKPPRR